MGGTIFISYRRGQDAGFAGRLFDRLERTFRRKALFMDVDSIAPGQDFVSILEARVAECDVLLALIGRGWLTADEAGRHRLDNPEDFVRIEIAAALAQAKCVIPVVIDDVSMPRSEDLPEILRPLVRRQATRLSHDRFKADSDRLIRALKQVLVAAETARQENEAQREARQQVPSPARDGMSRSQEGPSTPRRAARRKPSRAETIKNFTVSPASGPSLLAQASAEKDAAITDVSNAIKDLDGIINTTDDDAQRTALRQKSEDLSNKLTELVALRLGDILDGAKTQAALARLRGITGDLRTEAARIKQATDKLTAAARVISQVDRLLGFLGGTFA